MTEGTPLLTLVEVSKRIKGRQIVAPFSCQLWPGQVLALCGGNGAGKSTILRMIAGISQPTSGVIRVGGREWKRERKAFSSQIGYMPDDFSFGLRLSARETINFYAALRGVGETRVQELLTKVGLTDAQHLPVSAFSKGMRQRLLFAQALLADPALLLLDEPTNGLDPFWMKSFVHLVRECKQAGQTVVFSTHDLPIVEEVADHVLFLDQGKVVGAGTVDQFLDRYGSAGLHGAFAELVTNKRSSS